MAIQIRRGSNAEWETNNSNIVVGEPAVATDSKRAFIGTASGSYMELANLEAIAPAYDSGNSYMIDDYVSYQGKLYVCTVPTSGAWNASAWQATTLGQALAENAYSNYETYTMSGDIVSFPNGAGGVPVKDLKADVKAVQNLNGYDHPWVGGAGKNLFQSTDYQGSYNASAGTNLATGTANATYTMQNDGANITFASAWNGRLFVTSPLTAGTYTISMKSNSANIRATSYVTDGSLEVVSLIKNYQLNGSYTPDTVTVTSGQRIAFYASASASGSILMSFQVESGSSATTYERFENICPISGWNEVNVTRTGKNLLPKKTTNTSGSSNGITWTYNSDGTVTVSGTASATVIIPLTNNNEVYLPVGSYKLRGESASNYWVGIYYNAKSGNWYVTGDSAFSVTNRGDYVDPCVRIGSGASFSTPFTFHPMIFINSETDYTFASPLGTTYTTAVNVWDEEWEHGTINASTGENYGGGTSLQDRIRSKNHISVMPNTEYYFVKPTTASTNALFYYDNNKGFLQYVSFNSGGKFTTPSNAYYLRIISAQDSYHNDISINFPADNTQYIPFKGADTTADYMDTFGHGVYGGTLDVTTGVLTVTYGRLNLGDISWQYLNGNIFRGNTSTIAPNMEIATNDEVPLNAICESYKVEKYSGSGTKLVGLKNVNQIRIQDPQYSHDATGASALHDKVNNTYLVYKFATPTTYQLTPTQVRTLLGQNNIWADSGEVEATYRISNVQ